jgi:AbrB family looped-hinge helix DNA binding protein
MMITTTVTIDKTGRLVLPKPIRDALHLKAGDNLEVEQQDDSIVLRARRPDTELVKEDGMWVVKQRCPLTYSIPDLIAQHREDRIQTLIRRSLGEEEFE